MNHRWNLEQKIPACESTDGNDRTERTCPFCRLVMITVHYPIGRPERRWRSKDGVTFTGNKVPIVCTGGPESTMPELSEAQA